MDPRMSGSDADDPQRNGAFREPVPPPHRDTPPGLELIGPIRDARKLAELQLVIKSLGVQHGISSRDDGFYFLVPAKKAARVRDALIDYERENRDWPPRKAPRERLAYGGSSRLSVLWSPPVGRGSARASRRATASSTVRCGAPSPRSRCTPTPHT